MKKFTKIFKNQKGLTLIELLAVIVILAIVAAIAVPSISNIIGKQQDKAILADTSTILSSAKLAASNGECKSANAANEYECSADVLKGYVDSFDTKGATVIRTIDTVASGKVTTSGVWSVTYSELANVDKITVTKTNNTITEANLLSAMK